jgi:prolyl 4-hydroxylase
MDIEDLIRYFLESSVSGASRTQVRRRFKEIYELNDNQLNKLEELAKFKNKPKKINYRKFYKNNITKKAQRIYYPFTQLYKQENFLSNQECNQLIDMISTGLRPSTVADDGDTCLVNNYRTSKTSDLNYFKDPFYLSIDKKIASLVDLEPFFGETMQAQKYEVGEYYKEHYDFFSPFNHEFKTYCEWMGQRTWTTMIYLNDVEEGGETYFKYLNLKIKPKKGLLIAWNNLYSNGFPNYKTMHEALPPIKGSKYIITKWWRSWSLI